MGQIHQHLNVILKFSEWFNSWKIVFWVFFVVVFFQRAVCFEGNQLLGDDTDAFLDMIDIDMCHDDKEFQLNFDHFI